MTRTGAVLPDDDDGRISRHIYYDIIEGKSNMRNYVVITLVELGIVRERRSKIHQ